MAGKSTISITFKLDGDGKGFKDLAKDADGLKSIMTSTLSEAKKLSTGAINFAALASGIDAAQRSFNQLLSGMKNLTGAYATQETAETQLATVMQQRMNATEADIQAIKRLASAQQELGVIGDEVQLSGVQQVATFLNEKESIDTLLPAMNNLLAQQKGLNATTQDAISVGNLMGKVMQGQTSALTRVGISFDEAEENVLKYGTESERAAMLAQVITNNVGEMNAALAATDSGKQKQLDNRLGDIKERLGSLVNGALPFVTISAQALTAAGSVATLSKGTQTLTRSLTVSTASARLHRVAMVKLTAATGSATVAAATLTATYTLGLSLVITGLCVLFNRLGKSAKDSAREIEGVKEATQAFKDTTAQTNAALSLEIQNLASLIKSNGDATKAVIELNSKYGETLGYHKTAADWYDVLIRKSADYCKAIGYEAQARVIASQKAAKELELETLRRKREEMQASGTDKDTYKHLSGTSFGGNNKFRIETRQVDTKAFSALKKEIADAEWEVNQYTAEWDACIQKMQEANNSVSKPDGQIDANARSYDQLNRAIEDNNKALKNISPEEVAEINRLKKQNAELQKQKDLLGEQLGFSTPKTQKVENNAPIWDDSATTLKGVSGNIQLLTAQLQTATAEEAILINQQIELWSKKADAIKNAGKAVENNDPLWKEDAATLERINDNIQILTEKLQTASVSEAAHINQQIELWSKKADAIKNAGKAVENNAKAWNDSAATLKDIGGNLQILNDRLQTASISEAATINKEIELWNQKADAIKNAGITAEETGIKTSEALSRSWGGIKQIGGSIEGITNALQGNGNAWQTVVGLIDGFLGLYQGIQAVAGIIELLTATSAAHAATKGVEATAETTAATIRTTAAATNAATAAATIVSNKLLSASFKELAAAQYMAAHAYIPFEGFGIGMGFTTAMMAAVSAAGIPMLASGGIASGPTLAMVGEYAGASGNPEVIAPLDKLKGMLTDTGGAQLGGKLEFEIKGRTLVAILNKENNIIKRS